MRARPSLPALTIGGQEVRTVGLGLSVALTAAGGVVEVPDKEVLNANRARTYMLDRGAKPEEVPTDVRFLLGFAEWMDKNLVPGSYKSAHPDYGLRCEGADITPFAPGVWAAKTPNGLRKFTQADVARALNLHLDLGSESSGDISDLLERLAADVAA